MSDQFRVTAEDLGSGDRVAYRVSAGDYVLIATDPCRVTSEFRHDSGTVQITLKDHFPAGPKVRQIGPPPHRPERGSDVEGWLKAYRDRFAEPVGSRYAHPMAWHLIDEVLDEYRLRADVGAALDTPVGDLGPRAPGEQ